MFINFAGDNLAPVHPEIFRKLAEINTGPARSYGADPHTREAEKIFRSLIREDLAAYFVFNGTGANTVAIAACATPFSMVLTAPLAHITEDEAGSVQRFAGIPVRFAGNTPGKLTPSDLEPFLRLRGDVHKSQPDILSISQATETGDVYTLSELEALGRFCKQNRLYLHMDGARFANACAFLDITPAAMAEHADIISFGGTKNGLMGAEAVLVLNSTLKERAESYRKQGMQLASKMRYLAAQFTASFEDDLWLNNARHANKMCSLLAEGIRTVSGVTLLYEQKINMIFAELPKALTERLLKTFYFYTLYENEDRCAVRLMTSWNTTTEEVAAFIKEIN